MTLTPEGYIMVLCRKCGRPFSTLRATIGLSLRSDICPVCKKKEEEEIYKRRTYNAFRPWRIGDKDEENIRRR